MRTNIPVFGKRTPLTREHFSPFKEVYGDDANGGSPRVDQGESGRWCRWTREDIAKRGENLDITWLRDESLQSGDNLPEPDIIAAAIMTKLLSSVRPDGGFDGVAVRGRRNRGRFSTSRIKANPQ
jgi:type I restriction enzyme M protein